MARAAALWIKAVPCPAHRKAFISVAVNVEFSQGLVFGDIGTTWSSDFLIKKKVLFNLLSYI